MPYSDDYEPKQGIPIGQVATGYTSANGQRSILVFNEALWMPEMEASLMNPNQLRHYGVEIQDNPYDSHPMLIRKEDSDEGDFVACLKSQGTNIYIDTWTPTDKDLQEYPQVVLTSPRPWDPYEVKFPGISEVEMSKIEDRNISGVGLRSRRDRAYALSGIEFGDGYSRPI